MLKHCEYCRATNHLIKDDNSAAYFLLYNDSKFNNITKSHLSFKKLKRKVDNRNMNPANLLKELRLAVLNSNTWITPLITLNVENAEFMRLRFLKKCQNFSAQFISALETIWSKYIVKIYRICSNRTLFLIYLKRLPLLGRQQTEEFVDKRKLMWAE